MKNVLTSLAKSVLIPLRLPEAASARDAAIQKKIFASGMTTLIISNEEINNIVKRIKSLKESGLLMKVISETIQNEAKEQRDGFLGILLGTLRLLDANLLENPLTGKEVVRASEGTIRAGKDFKCCLIL